ncbi:WS/DGAT/MGAT family O-acyltransferase [Zavarzinia compransoris]|uniref:diacylglycerol O-acyltransferase n=1 Tax=Zavarzinia compransoris TaxID=1264899 RepID=A0A317EA63_9PROT|nr:wax ester/triacylglycerol synthase family O-acyltransferase [Zavarzinia compransoris]PWR22045.1 wax ester/triacylglycerol synthase family O-acyltransferase [Zavarzinia compransoris]TDP47214.1 diacylglycerol O-acyltransferase [Zavarzinia compransoris]
MQQLSGLDTTFLNLETNTCPMHVGGVVILEPPAGQAPQDSYRAIFDLVESRLDHIPPMRRRLLMTPFDLDHPYWIEDPDFDLVHHLRRRALPSPGDRAALAALVCELAATRLDRNLPLWELHVVEGLEGGRLAVVTKMHHAAIDGVSGAEILSTLLDLSPEPARLPPPAKPWQPDDIPSLTRRLFTTAKSLSRRPADSFRLLKTTMPALASLGREAIDRGKMILQGEATRSVMGLAPRTRFNRQITARRSYAYGGFPLAAIKALRKALGVTLNDVVLGLCAGALRRYLEERRELPDHALIAGVPMSTRADEQKGTGGNHVTFLRAALHTDIADPLLRLRRISEDMGVAKEKMRALPADLMGDWARLPSPALMARAARLYENFGIQSFHAPAFNVVISNVPGPPVPLYFAGMRVRANYPVSIPFHGVGLNITLMSYCDSIDYGLTADHDTVPDIDHFDALLQQALKDLQQAAGIA